MFSGRRIDWFVKTVWTLLTDWHNRVFAQKIINHKSEIINHKYDLILCTAFSDFPLGAAARIADAWNVPLLCDIRDLDEQVDNSRYQYHHQSKWLMPFRHIYRAIHIRRRNRVLRVANAITTISPWHADFINKIINHKSKIINHKSPVTVIYNGYDSAQFYPQDTRTDTFRITYIGSLFPWQQPALRKVQQAIDEINQIINHQSPITLSVHTPQRDPVAHDRLGDAIRRSGIMLVLTSTDTHGMLTTKFYEALGCEKPVLCVPSDKGSLAELIAYTNAGIATDDIERIKTFIMEKYRQWQQNGFTRQPTTHRDAFSREAQCEQMEKIINHKS